MAKFLFWTTVGVIVNQTVHALTGYEGGAVAFGWGIFVGARMDEWFDKGKPKG